MAETKQIARISIVTDSETSYDNIGDIDGGFDEIQLKKYIKNYGPQGLCKQLNDMIFQVWQTVKEINAEKSESESAEASLKTILNELCIRT